MSFCLGFILWDRQLQLHIWPESKLHEGPRKDQVGAASPDPNIKVVSLTLEWCEIPCANSRPLQPVDIQPTQQETTWWQAPLHSLQVSRSSTTAIGYQAFQRQLPSLATSWCTGLGPWPISEPKPRTCQRLVQDQSSFNFPLWAPAKLKDSHLATSGLDQLVVFGWSCDHHVRARAFCHRNFSPQVSSFTSSWRNPRASPDSRRKAARFSGA